MDASNDQPQGVSEKVVDEGRLEEEEKMTPSAAAI